MENFIGKRVVAKKAVGGEYCQGVAVAYSRLPTFVIEKENGERFAWEAHLVELAPDPTAETDTCLWEIQTNDTVTECGQTIDLIDPNDYGPAWAYCPFCRKSLLVFTP